jgi:hypothetical protein
MAKLDDSVNVDMDPEEALRLLLENEPREEDEEAAEQTRTEAE